MMLRVSGRALENRLGDKVVADPCGADVDVRASIPMDPVVRCCIVFCCMTLRLRSSHLEMLSWKAGKGCISSLMPDSSSRSGSGDRLLAPPLPLSQPPLPVADEGALPASLVPLESEALWVNSRSGGCCWPHEEKHESKHAGSLWVRTGGGGTSIGEPRAWACCCCCCRC